ncbi:MAG: transglycosylase domain-containing protein [Ferruginibacter sp.]|nr:penicillin-binding protein [Ferruginibacter sp.]
MKRSVKIIWFLFFSGILFVVVLFAAANYGVFGKMPSLQELENPEADLASEVISADGLLMGKYYAENRSEVRYQEISPKVINALIATEDVRFEQHSGVDAKAVLRAIKSLGKDGGGSTITQQLAKMILDQGRGNIFKRSVEKIKEWIVAVKLERNFTKEEIITLYLNRAPWGNVFGIRNASRTYFQKEPKDLKQEEAAVLVGMLKGFIYEPIRHPAAAMNRRNTVLEQMVVADQKFLTKAEAAKLKAKPLITNFKPIDEAIGIAPHYRRALIEVMREWCKKNKNPKTGEPYNLFSDGLKIYTTIDSRMQKYAEEAMDAHIPGEQRKLNGALKYRGDNLWKKHENILEKAMKQTVRWKIMKEDGVDDATIIKTFSVKVPMKIFSWSKGGDKHEMDTLMTPMDSIKYHKKLLQSSFLAMDPRSGEIKAWVGGTDFRWFKYDHVTAMRQVGSTFKPLVYTLAVQDAGYTPETYIPGGPLTLGGKTITTGGGTCAYCLAKSINGCAWHLIGTIGVKRTIEFAQQCGIKVKIPPYYSIALGAAEIPMIQMLQAYTMFPNRGYNTEPVFVTRIEDKNGNLIHEFPMAQSKQVIGEADAYTMVKMMQGVIKEGTAKRLNSYGIPAEKAGKTGTTNGNTDGWFIGYTPTLLAGTWVGCEDPFIPIYGNAGGAEMAAPTWGLFMKKVYADSKFKNYTTQKEFAVPVVLKNDPILADANFYQTLKRGDIPTDDNGNAIKENAEDGSEYLTEDPEYTIENNETTVPKDTGKNTEPIKPKEDKTTTPAATILNDKKALPKPKPKAEPKSDDGGF